MVIPRDWRISIERGERRPWYHDDTPHSSLESNRASPISSILGEIRRTRYHRHLKQPKHQGFSCQKRAVDYLFHSARASIGANTCGNGIHTGSTVQFNSITYTVDFSWQRTINPKMKGHAIRGTELITSVQLKDLMQTQRGRPHSFLYDLQ
jgi:hypothetical protein